MAGPFLVAGVRHTQRNSIEGFRICYTLRDVRNAIAKANEIPFISYPCNNPHDNCSGNCPLCNEEVKYLVEKLDDLHNAGKNISIIGIASNILKKRDPFISQPEISVLDSLDYTQLDGYLGTPKHGMNILKHDTGFSF